MKRFSIANLSFLTRKKTRLPLFIILMTLLSFVFLRPQVLAINFDQTLDRLKEALFGGDYVQELTEGEFLLEGKHPNFDVYFGDRARGGAHRVKVQKNGLGFDLAFLETTGMVQTSPDLAATASALNKEGLTEEQLTALEAIESQLEDIETYQATLSAEFEEARQEVDSIDQAVKQIIPGTNLGFDEFDAGDKKQMVVKNSQVEPGIDIYYWKQENDLKEKIIFREPPAAPRLIFSIDTQGLTPFDIGAGVIYFKDSRENYVFRMTKGYVKDLTNAFSNEVNTVVEDGKLIHLLDPEWLASPDRVYPLTLYFDIQYNTAGRYGGLKEETGLGSGAVLPTATISATPSSDPTPILTPTESPAPSPTESVAPDGQPSLPPTSFRVDEEPEFAFHFTSPEKSLLAKFLELFEVQANEETLFRTHLYDHRGEEIEAKPKVDSADGENYQVAVPKSVLVRPGAYRIELEVEQDGQSQTVFQDFTWGVLAINPNRSVYLPGEEAKLAMAVLDEEGKMVCDAKLELRIKNKELKIDDMLSTEDGTIRVNPECRLKDFTLKPDYEAEYKLGDKGIYELTLTAETQNGTWRIGDLIEVKDSTPFEIERHGPTRIFPPEAYPMVIKVKVNEDFEGKVAEVVPDSFEITDFGGEPDFFPEGFSEPEPGKTEGFKQIVWQVDWQKGKTYELSYQFKAPDQSPQFYLLGPLSLRPSEGKTLQEPPSFGVKENRVFAEARFWQIASDAVETRYMRGDQHTINGLTDAYNLGIGQTGPTQSAVLLSTIGNGNGGYLVEWGIRVFIRNSSGVEYTEVTSGTPVAQVSRQSSSDTDVEGMQAADWACPGASGLSSTDSIVVRVYMQILADSKPWSAMAVFSTEQLGASVLSAATWTVNYYTRYETNNSVPRGDDFTRGTFYWGPSPYNSRIENFTWSLSNGTPTAPTVLFTNETDASSGVAGPTAVGEATPVFSAVYNDPDSGDVADDYQLIVYSDSGCSSQVWDSTKTAMSNCTQGNRCLTASGVGIEFGGTALSFNGKQYYWKIKFWDDDDAEGAFSGCTTDYFYILSPADQMRHGNYFFNKTTERIFTW